MSSEKHADPAEIPASLTDTYDIGETLGTGHFSKVKLGINKSTKEKVAIKIIKKPTGNKISMLKAEVRAPPPPRPRARFFLSAARPRPLPPLHGKLAARPLPSAVRSATRAQPACGRLVAARAPGCLPDMSAAAD